MAWQDTMIMMLRHLINDLNDESSSTTYTDGRLEETLVVAANIVKHEISFNTTYTVHVPSVTISPDPTASSTEDNDAFVNFTVLKAACVMDWSLYRTKALVAGIRAKCGPAVLETLKHLDGFKELLSGGPCAAYEKLKDQWVFGNGNICRAILSPFVSNNFDPDNLGTYYDSHSRDYYS
jgi:hypothetical protein